MKNRSGSYKKILIDSESLSSHGDTLRRVLLDLKMLELTPHLFTTLYLLLYLRIKHSKNWLQKKSHAPTVIHNDLTLLLSVIPESFKLSVWEIEKLEGLSATDLFIQYNLKAIPESINRTMNNWQMGLWDIVCLEHIPSPRELLSLQVKNSRCITLITKSELVDTLIFGTRDPLSFLLHDLMHADQFFNQSESLIGQLGFYKLIHKIIDQPQLKNLLKQDLQFRHEFEYVSSDMNAYVIHLYKCLKSAIMRTTEGEIFFHSLMSWWDMNEAEVLASEALNSPEFTIENEMVLKSFFEAHREILK